MSPHLPFLLAVSVWTRLRRLGGLGLILLGIADSSVIPLTGSMDVLTVYLAARHREPWPYYALMATLGAVIGGVLRAIARDRPLRAFLESDPEAALRLLTGSRSTVHRGMASALEKLIDLERGRGCFDARLDTPTLSYAIVRISEGFLYADVIADRAPDIDRAITVIEALLTGLDRRSAPV